MDKKDFHKYKQKLASVLGRIKYLETSEINRTHIRAFANHLFLHQITAARVIKYLEVLRKFARFYYQDFAKLDKQHIEAYALHLQQQKYTLWTLHTNRICIRRFYKWLLGNDEYYPEQVKWIPGSVPYTHLPQPNPGDMLTEQEIETLLDHTINARDKAFLSILAETGARIGEVGTLQIKDIILDDKGALIFLTGKTGQRRVRICKYARYVADWLALHPQKNNTECPVWVQGNISAGIRQLSYRSLNKALRAIGKRAGIEKRVNPHNFRHARATHLGNGKLNEFQLSKYLGWIPGSKMARTYIHLSDKAVNDQILIMNGIPPEADQQTLPPQICTYCHAVNLNTAETCHKCHTPLCNLSALPRHDVDATVNNILANPEIRDELLRRLQQETSSAPMVYLEHSK